MTAGAWAEGEQSWSLRTQAQRTWERQDVPGRWCRDPSRPRLESKQDCPPPGWRPRRRVRRQAGVCPALGVQAAGVHVLPVGRQCPRGWGWEQPHQPQRLSCAWRAGPAITVNVMRGRSVHLCGMAVAAAPWAYGCRAVSGAVRPRAGPRPLPPGGGQPGQDSWPVGACSSAPGCRGCGPAWSPGPPADSAPAWSASLCRLGS